PYFSSLRAPAALPQPHAFPTRRSSDLGLRRVRRVPPQRGRAVRARRRLHLRLVPPHHRRGGGAPPALRRLRRPAGLDRPRGGLHRRAAAGLLARRDRKSTRLNSSHVKISYAVFCLKKKITITM